MDATDLKSNLEKAEQDKARLEERLAEILSRPRSGVSSEVRGLLWGRERSTEEPYFFLVGNALLVPVQLQGRLLTWQASQPVASLIAHSSGKQPPAKEGFVGMLLKGTLPHTVQAI